MIGRIKRAMELYPARIGFPIGVTIGLAITLPFVRKLYKEN